MNKFFKKFFTLFLIFISFFTIFLKTTSFATNSTSFPVTNAKHAIIFNRNSKQIIYGKKENEKCKMASTTKILTAILTLENTNLDQIVTVSNKTAQAPKSRIGLSTNDKISVKDLLYGLMLYSGNDAAVALAEHIGGTVENFAVLMNEKAKSLGMLNSHFITPNGLDSDEHYSTAYDLALLTDYALQNETFCKIINTKTYTININGRTKTINNTHELLGNLEGVYGGKTGFTSGANRCLITACKRGDFDIICVVLGCDTKKDRTKDSINLINYTFENYELINIQDFIINYFNNWKTEHKNNFTIDKGLSNKIDLNIDINKIPYSILPINKNLINTMKANIYINTFYEAPLLSNTSIGNLQLSLDNSKLFSIPIINSNTIKKKNIIHYLNYFFKNYFLFTTPEKRA